MAIAPVKRIDITAHASLKKEILGYLQRTGFVEFISRTDDERLEYGEAELETRIRDAAQELQDIQSAISVLETFEEKPGLIASLKAQPPAVSAQEVKTVSKDSQLLESVAEINSIHERLPVIRNEKRKLLAEQELALPWADSAITSEMLDNEGAVHIVPGQIAPEQLDHFQKTIESAARETGLAIIQETDEWCYLALIFHESVRDQIIAVLPGSGFAEMIPLRPNCDIQTTLASIEEDLKALNDEQAALQESLAAYAADLPTLRILFDQRVNANNALSVRRLIGNTSAVFTLRGWMAASRCEKLRNELEELGPVDVEVKEPSDEDGAPPVILENPGFLKSFELVTELYGLPAYKGLDPTLALAPFFFIFFGLCLSDAGYGIMLAAAMIVAMRWLGIKGKVYSLFIFGGIATIIGGAVTGSWFGVNVLLLPEGHWAHFLSSFALFDPLGTQAQPFMGLRLEGTMAFFYLSVALGYFQICFGTTIAAVFALKHKRIVDGLCDHGAWLTVYIGLGLVILSVPDIIGMPSYGWTALKTPGLVLIAAGLITRQLFHPIGIALTDSNKQSIGAALGGIGISLIQILDNSKNLLGNVLSYCRLMALGMATGVIGSIINDLAIKVGDLIPVAGIIVMIIMMVGGHVINLMINLLGSFVHTARLQYVEFFPYFFEGGGERFKPFASTYKHIQFKD